MVHSYLNMKFGLINHFKIKVVLIFLNLEVKRFIELKRAVQSKYASILKCFNLKRFSYFKVCLLILGKIENFIYRLNEKFIFNFRFTD